MKFLPACFQERLESFHAAKTKPSRRTSARSKKTQQPQSSSWPLESPAPFDLAFAGFLWKPTSASPDNVQCFSCDCQLDGWEPSDVPAYEHLTHSPNCGFAMNVCIRLRNGDPERAERDPMSDEMLDARKKTFGVLWPLKAEEGYPTVEQMVDAGWYYDPSPELPDGVTCAYCSLSLDSWDVGDNPFEEHQRRASDCLFFRLKELYHPVEAPLVEEPKKTKGKRTSTRSTRSSSASTRVKKAPAKSKAAKPPSRAKRTTKDAEPKESELESQLEQGPEQSVEPDITLEPEIKSAPAKKGRQARAKRGSEASVQSTAATRQKRGKKRTSEDVAPDISMAPESPKRMRFSEISSIRPESVFESTPREAALTPEQRTPEKRTPDNKRAKKWEPVDIDKFFRNDALGFISGVLVDAGLDKENVGANALEAVNAGLTSPEKKMTVEEWVMYNAKRGEEKLRAECERQIAAFEAEGRRALAAVKAL